jgi:hypothetical protein
VLYKFFFITCDQSYSSVWYHGGYMIITVIHLDFSKATLNSFCKITVNHRDSGVLTVIPNIHLVFFCCCLIYEHKKRTPFVITCYSLSLSMTYHHLNMTFERKWKGILWLYLQAGYMLYDRVIRPAEVGVTHEVEGNNADEWLWHEEMPE